MGKSGGALPGYTDEDGRRKMSTSEAAALWQGILGGDTTEAMTTSKYRRRFDEGRIRALGVQTGEPRKGDQKITDMDSLLDYFERYAQEVLQKTRVLKRARARELKRRGP